MPFKKSLFELACLLLPFLFYRIGKKKSARANLFLLSFFMLKSELRRTLTTTTTNKMILHLSFSRFFIDKEGREKKRRAEKIPFSFFAICIFKKKYVVNVGKS